MDIQSFIQSGLLEAYVLGQCTAAERAEVERMAAAHPEIRAELEAIGHALERVALAAAVSPPPGLKDQLLARIRQEPAGAGPGRAKGSFQWLGWLVSALLLAYTAVAYFRSAAEQGRSEIRVAELEKQVEDCQTQSRRQARQQEIIALLSDRNTQTIVLSDGPAPKITATVWHNPVRRETALDINSLPAPDAGKYFQFWAIVDGQPVSMGMVAIGGADSVQALPFIPNARAFAISTENNPNGNPAPTQVVLVGPVG